MIICLVLAMAAPLSAGASNRIAADDRQVFGPDSPAWLGAIGRLQVPSSRYDNGRTRHHTEDCSATLVTASSHRRADTLVTAWHCLESYRDLSKPISFSLPGSSGQPVNRQAYRLADGGGMHGDWAILRLYRPIDPAEATAMLVKPDNTEPASAITMAGYSRDEGLGENGQRLTYHTGCRVTATAPEGNDSDCLAYKGASGGAVIQVSGSGEARYVGVISRGDSEGTSIYVPVSRFRPALMQYLQ